MSEGKWKYRSTSFGDGTSGYLLTKPLAMKVTIRLNLPKLTRYRTLFSTSSQFDRYIVHSNSRIDCLNVDFVLKHLFSIWFGLAFHILRRYYILFLVAWHSRFSSTRVSITSTRVRYLETILAANNDTIFNEVYWWEKVFVRLSIEILNFKPSPFKS